MNHFFRPAALAWLALVVAATGWLAWLDARQIGRLEQVGGATSTAPVDASSPTGYAHGTRTLLLPDSASSQPWIMDVQKLMATNSWQATRADYDNAPEGRPVAGPTAYRWWLRLVTEAERLRGVQPAGIAVERAALHADPVLHLLLCLGAGLFVAWRFGVVAGAFLALGSAVLLAYSQVFSPGQPNEHGLFLVTTLASLLLLLSGWRTPSERAARWWLTTAGGVAGFGFWLDAGSGLVVIAAVLAGGLFASWMAKRAPGPHVRTLPWRAWAAGGAVVAIAGWLVDGRPGGVAGVSPGQNHPLLALVWIGAAEILVRVPALLRGKASRREWSWFAGGVGAALGPIAWLVYRGGVADFGPNHPALAGRGSLLGWFRSDGLSGGLIAALLPLLVLVGAGYLLRGRTNWRQPLAFVFGATVVVLVVGCFQLRWWGVVDTVLISLLAVVVAAIAAEGVGALVARTALGFLLLPAFGAAWPRPASADDLVPAEARALVERDLAQWLALRTEPGTIAFAPPALSGSLCYYGGLRVVTSPYPGNQDGLALAARIAGTPSTDEAQALIQRRGIQYIVLPSWDDSLDQLAQGGSPTPERSLVALLRQWLPPRWLRPVAYQLPVIPGLEQDSVAVFEVVEPQENAIALSRLAEYFVETNRPALAAAVAEALEKSFAADAGAMIARAKVALARGDGRALARVMPELLPAVADGRDEDLSWERRANLALVLAQTKHPDLARAQLEFCLREADAERLRSLGPVSLFRLLSVAKTYHLEFADPQLPALALALLPAEFQAQLGR
jgi:hypothetical protein